MDCCCLKFSLINFEWNCLRQPVLTCLLFGNYFNIIHCSLFVVWLFTLKNVATRWNPEKVHPWFLQAVVNGHVNVNCFYDSINSFVQTRRSPGPLHQAVHGHSRRQGRLREDLSDTRRRKTGTGKVVHCYCYHHRRRKGKLLVTTCNKGRGGGGGVELFVYVYWTFVKRSFGTAIGKKLFSRKRKKTLKE